MANSGPGRHRFRVATSGGGFGGWCRPTLHGLPERGEEDSSDPDPTAQFVGWVAIPVAWVEPFPFDRTSQSCRKSLFGSGPFQS